MSLWSEEIHYARNAVEGSAALRDAINRLRLRAAPIVWFEPDGVSPMLRKPRPRKRKRFYNNRPRTKYSVPPILVAETQAHHPRIEQVKEWVADHFKIHPFWMAHPARQWSVSHPRQVAMYLARKMVGASLKTIGRHFDRDHTTVMHAIRAVGANEKMLADANEIAAAIEKSGDKPTISKTPVEENAIEQTVKMQAESMAA